MLPVAARSSEPLDYLVSIGNEASKGIAVAHTRSARLVATRNLPLVTIYDCRLRGRGKLSVSANRSTPSRVFIFYIVSLPWAIIKETEKIGA